MAAWNEKYPHGTKVNLRKDSGEIMETETRSAAYVCESGYPVIFLEGVPVISLMTLVFIVFGFGILIGIGITCLIMALAL